jgi:hypothetical protein
MGSAWFDGARRMPGRGPHPPAPCPLPPAPCPLPPQAGEGENCHCNGVIGLRVAGSGALRMAPRGPHPGEHHSPTLS